MLIVLPEPRNTPKPSDCQDPLVSIIRQPSSVMTPSGESGFSRACCHRCEVKQGRICHLSRIGISLRCLRSSSWPKNSVFVSGSAGLAITETLYCTAYSRHFKIQQSPPIHLVSPPSRKLRRTKPLRRPDSQRPSRFLPDAAAEKPGRRG